MKDMITVNGQVITRIVYRGEPVITLPMIDQLHGKNGRADRTAKRNFRENRSQFIKNEDYFQVPYEEWKQILGGRLTSPQDDLTAHLKDEFDGPEETWGGHRGEMFFLTLTGYLLLVKTFRDDLAWEIQRILVRHYFSNHIPMGDKNRPNPEYVNWLKEQRLVWAETRKFQTFARGEAEILKKAGGHLEDLSHLPPLQEAVERILKADPESKQLKMFGEV